LHGETGCDRACVCVCACAVLSTRPGIYMCHIAPVSVVAHRDKRAAFYGLCVSLVGCLGVAAHSCMAAFCRYWGAATQAVTCQPSGGVSLLRVAPILLQAWGLSGFARV